MASIRVTCIRINTTDYHTSFASSGGVATHHRTTSATPVQSEISANIGPRVAGNMRYGGSGDRLSYKRWD